MKTNKLSKQHRSGLLLSVAAVMLIAVSARADAPEGWLLSGSNSDAYKVGASTTDDGNTVAFLRSRADSPGGFATVMQSFSASRYQGQRLRLSGEVKAMNVTGWAGLWMRIDGRGGLLLGFDNMKHRPIVGTRDWTDYEVVLDIPADSLSIAFGVLLHGGGEVLIDNLRFEVVDDSVSVTSATPDPQPEPINLDFES